MGIVSEDIQRVKESADLVALISEHVPLKRAGRRFTGCCPFHDEKTPSFSVNPDLGFYYCFGCNKKGDAITFLREFLQMDFAEAVEELAKKSNITLHYDSNKTQNKSALVPIYECLNDAAQYYNELLKKDQNAKSVRQYVRSRGFGSEAVDAFTIGYSPNAFDELANKLLKKYSEQNLIEAGLCFKNSRGNLNDVFRNRLMFPIRNPAGAVIGFGARSLDGTPPKYKNTSETKLYRKSNVLYNLDKAKSEAVKAGNFVVCEGYTDVIAMSLAGVSQAVATCGTAATIDHVKLMSKYVDKIVLAFDTDSAGQNATDRWLAFLSETKADIYVARSSSKKDPAELYIENPAELNQMVEDAIPFLEFLLGRIVAKTSLSESIEQRARVAQNVVDVIRQHPSPLVREGYVMQFAPDLGFEPDWFFEQLKKPAPQSKDPERKSMESPVKQEVRQEEKRSVQNAEKSDPRQRELLRLCVHEPHSVARYIRGEVFSIPEYREIFDALVEHENIADALSALREESNEILTQIMVEDVAHVEEIAPYSLDVFSRVVESQMKDFLHQLVLKGADNTSRVKKLLDVMTTSIEKGDGHTVVNCANELLEIRTLFEEELKSSRV
jgi:DNA primase